MKREKKKLPEKVYLVLPKGLAGPVAYASWSKAYARNWAKNNWGNSERGFRVVGLYVSPELPGEGRDG